MDQPEILFREKTAKHLIQVLTKNRFEASYAPTAAQARSDSGTEW